MGISIPIPGIPGNSGNGNRKSQNMHHSRNSPFPGNGNEFPLGITGIKLIIKIRFFDKNLLGIFILDGKQLGLFHSVKFYDISINIIGFCKSLDFLTLNCYISRKLKNSHIRSIVLYYAMWSSGRCQFGDVPVEGP